MVGVHSCLLKKGAVTVNWENEPAKAGHFSDYRPYDSIQLNHYFYKSLEEHREKIERGSASGALVKRAVPFTALDKTFGDVDESALTFRRKTLENIDYFSRLPQRLLRFGRHFAGRGEKIARLPFRSDLHVFDPWRWFVTRAISNLLANEPRVRLDYKDLPATGPGNRFSLQIEAPTVDERWSDSLHMHHLAELANATWIDETTTAEDTLDLSLTLPNDGVIACVSAIAHVYCEREGESEISVRWALRDGLIGAHSIKIKPGHNIVVCEVVETPTAVAQIAVSPQEGLTVRRLYGIAYA